MSSADIKEVVKQKYGQAASTGEKYSSGAPQNFKRWKAFGYRRRRRGRV